MNVFIWQYRNTELSVRVCLCVCVRLMSLLTDVWHCLQHKHWDQWQRGNEAEPICLLNWCCKSEHAATNIGTEPYSLQSLTARLSTPLLYQCSRVLLLKPQVRAQRAFGFEIPRDSNSRICFIGRRYKYSEFPLMSKNRFFSSLFFS